MKTGLTFLTITAIAILLAFVGCADSMSAKTDSQNDGGSSAQVGSHAGEMVSWLTDYQQALTMARETGKPILVDFTGSDWCGWCIKLHEEVFETPEFQSWASQNVVLLELDYPRTKPQDEKLKEQNSQLARKFNVQGFPTVLFIDANENVVGKYGYDRGGPAVWTSKASSMIHQGSNNRTGI